MKLKLVLVVYLELVDYDNRVDESTNVTLILVLDEWYNTLSGIFTCMIPSIGIGFLITMFSVYSTNVNIIKLFIATLGVTLILVRVPADIDGWNLKLDLSYK